MDPVCSGVKGAFGSSSKMRQSCSENVILFFFNFHANVPVRFRRWPCARNASLRHNFSSAHLRSCTLIEKACQRVIRRLVWCLVHMVQEIELSQMDVYE